MNPLMGNRKKNNLPHWYRSTVSQVDVMRDGTQVRKTPRSITIWTRDVIRLSNPSRTVFGSSPTLTTKVFFGGLGNIPYLCGTKRDIV
jgi:hypothetical protein